MASGHNSFLAIRYWNASLYSKLSHKWLYGELRLSSDALDFQLNDSDGNLLILHINFTDIISMSKALSSLIFPAITVVTKNNETHWFASFQNRNATFLIIQHFYLASLHQTRPISASSKPSSSETSQKRTEFGTKILSSVYDSQTTLKKAAVNLVEQGHQLNNAANNMGDIHEDLTIVDHISSGLNSWMGRWKMPAACKTEELLFVKANDIPDILDLEALYTQITSTNVGTQVLGVFRLAKDGITVLDLKQKVIQYFKWSDVSRIRVVSPWEILVTRFLIGQPDLSYCIIGLDMPQALHKLQLFVPQKLEYFNPSGSYFQESYDKRAESQAHKTITSSLLTANHPLVSSFTSTSINDILQSSETQQQEEKQKQIISEAEISELSEALSSLKALALDVQVEQESQIETIEELTVSVSRANDRLRDHNATINKLLK